ncbi:MAG: 30S ribosome-binding factor RbfA [Hyphomonadaceae bacterium]
MSRRPHLPRGAQSAHGPSQRQLRAGELVRHALVEVLAREDLRDPDLQGVSVTVGEVRASPDLKHMTAFVAALGEHDPRKIAAALTRCAPFLRGRLARSVELRHTPQLHFEPDVSYEEARHIDELLKSPSVARDLKSGRPQSEGDV